jgi:hypothetical protein
MVEGVRQLLSLFYEDTNTIRGPNHLPKARLLKSLQVSIYEFRGREGKTQAQTIVVLFIF